MMLEKKYFQSTALFLCLIFSALTSYADNRQEQIIQEPINQLHEALINIMVISNSTSFEERYKYLEPIIEKNFDIDLISKVVLSRYWKSIDQETKIKFIDTFKSYLFAKTSTLAFNKSLSESILFNSYEANSILSLSEESTTKIKQSVY